MTEKKPINTPLEKIGKEMPFTVPDGFFVQLEDQIISQAGLKPAILPPPRRNLWRIITGATVAAAATVALVISFTKMPSHDMMQQGMTLEQAFNNLSQADQEWLLESYRSELIAEYGPTHP